jgi:hypothetical protein
VGEWLGGVCGPLRHSLTRALTSLHLDWLSMAEWVVNNGVTCVREKVVQVNE